VYNSNYQRQFGDSFSLNADAIVVLAALYQKAYLSFG